MLDTLFFAVVASVALKDNAVYQGMVLFLQAARTFLKKKFLACLCARMCVSQPCCCTWGYLLLLPEVFRAAPTETQKLTENIMLQKNVGVLHGCSTKTVFDSNMYI